MIIKQPIQETVEFQSSNVIDLSRKSLEEDAAAFQEEDIGQLSYEIGDGDSVVINFENEDEEDDNIAEVNTDHLANEQLPL